MAYRNEVQGSCQAGLRPTATTITGPFLIDPLYRMPNSQNGSTNSSGQMDVDSDSDGSSEFNYRTIGIVGIGVLGLPSRFAITPGMTYEDLNIQINRSVSKETLVALVPVLGPYPIFRYPLHNEQIAPSVRRANVVEQDDDTSLVVVRTRDEDVAVPISLSEEDDESPIINVVARKISINGYSPILIRDHLGMSDIGHQSVKISKLSSKRAHPTIAFVETESERLKFCAKFQGNLPVPAPLEFLCARVEILVKRASCLESESLSLIHLTRALLHLIVSAQKIASDHWDSRGLDYYTNLHRLANELENRIEKGNCSEQDLESSFNELCGDYFGAVAVRRSYAVFSRLKIRPPVQPSPATIPPMHVHETLRRNPKRTTVQKSTKTRIGLRDPKNATASTSTVPPPTNRQKDPIIPASVPQNLQTIDWNNERRKLDKLHRSWLDHYAGNTTEANHEVLRRIVHHIQTYGTPPMEVFVKVGSKSGVEKVTCGVCRAKCLEGLISSDKIREFPTVQKAASHITSEHWQLKLWSCPNGCGKSFHYRNSIKDPRSHSGECKFAATPSGVIVSVLGARDPPVSTRNSDHSTRVSLPGALYNYSSNPTVTQNHQADHKEEGMNEDKSEMLEDTDASDDVGVPPLTAAGGIYHPWAISKQYLNPSPANSASTGYQSPSIATPSPSPYELSRGQAALDIVRIPLAGGPNNDQRAIPTYMPSFPPLQFNDNKEGTLVWSRPLSRLGALPEEIISDTLENSLDPTRSSYSSITKDAPFSTSNSNTVDTDNHDASQYQAQSGSAQQVMGHLLSPPHKEYRPSSSF
ncbi:hypothetical protein FRC18_008649 [Serendipita sp. 400]|nr:hypothetical protein FRC18_008649 [Serendipita sp. 400]